MDGSSPLSVPTALYRLFTGDDELLYIGATRWPVVRRSQHAHKKHWWPEVQRMTIDWYPGQAAAEAAEAAAILAEQPKYNIMRKDPAAVARQARRMAGARAAGLAQRRRDRPGV